MEINTQVQAQTARTALDNAKKGVQKSEQQFAEAADEIIKIFTEGANEVSTVTTEDAQAGAEPTVEASSEANLVSGVVDAKAAEIAYKANLETMKVADELQEEAIDILA